MRPISAYYDLLAAVYVLRWFVNPAMAFVLRTPGAAMAETENRFHFDLVDARPGGGYAQTVEEPHMLVLGVAMEDSTQ